MNRVTNMNADRVERVRAHMRAQHIEQLVITQPQSIYYLTDEWVMPLDRLDALILTLDSASMLCYNLAVIEPANCKTVIYSDMGQALPCLFELLKRVPTGVDGGMPARFGLPLIEALSGVRVEVSDCVERARMVKDADEIALLAHASELTDTVFKRAFGRVAAGMTETDIAHLFADEFAACGAGIFPGLPMAAVGAGTADPHHSTGSARLQNGDALMVDTGMRIDGYYSDTTRTVFLGLPGAEQRRVYQTVLESNMEAIAAIRPGALLWDVDAAARRVIARAGYGEYFTHKTCHGVGIDFHELPTCRDDCPVVLEPGMAFSVEPGIYLPGRFGVRIEDLAIVTPDGARIVTHCDKALTVL